MTVPAAAQALGFTKVAIDSRPLLSDVSMDGLTGPSEWYNGQQWTPTVNQPLPSCYTSFHNDPALPLCVHQGGSIGMADRNMQLGKWPTLDGAKGFYVEFQVELSGQNLDYIPGLWLMPVEHAHLNDHYEDLDPGKPAFQRWQEFDVHEGGRGVDYQGFKPCAISWSGVFGSYAKEQTQFGYKAPAINQSGNWTYAVLWDPIWHAISYYFNGALMYQTTGTGISPVVTRQHFFPIISAVIGPRKLPYFIKVNHILAMVPLS